MRNSSDIQDGGGSRGRKRVLLLFVLLFIAVISKSRTHFRMEQSEELAKLRKEVSTLLGEVESLRTASTQNSLHATNSTPSAGASPAALLRLPVEPLPPQLPPLPQLFSALPPSPELQTTRVFSSPKVPGRNPTTVMVFPSTNTKSTSSNSAAAATTNSHHSNNSHTTNSRVCYCSLLANCDLRYKYRVYLSGIVVFTARLRALGSKSDVVVLVNFSPNGGLSQLPQSDLDLLAKWHIKLKYVDSVWDRFLDQQPGSRAGAGAAGDGGAAAAGGSGGGGGEIHDVQRAKEKSVMYNKIFAVYVCGTKRRFDDDSMMPLFIGPRTTKMAIQVLCYQLSDSHPPMHAPPFS